MLDEWLGGEEKRGGKGKKPAPNSLLSILLLGKGREKEGPPSHIISYSLRRQAFGANQEVGKEGGVSSGSMSKQNDSEKIREERKRRASSPVVLYSGGKREGGERAPAKQPLSEEE